MNFNRILLHEKRLDFRHKTIIYLGFSFIFAFIYNQMDHEEFKGFTEESRFFDHLYYSVNTQATIGYGDISPVSNRAKLVSMIHALLIFILFIL
tara:strand:- start:681 stop:962 length:282 start_codon:yes stop_codon:yes gene_type:complete